MFAAMLCISAIARTRTAHESITVRTFSLITDKGENVLREDFDRRRLTDSFDRLALKFHAFEKQFEFKLERSYPIFAPEATIKMTGSGKGYAEIPPPDILSFSSPHNDAAITFINNTAVNGVVFQHDRAFDVVASADLLVLRPVRHNVNCGVAPSTASHYDHQPHEHGTHGRLLSIADIDGWSNCYTGESKTHVLSIGFGITSGLYKKQFSQDFATATTWVASIVARSNVVFMRQMNLLIQVGDLVLVNPSSTEVYSCKDKPTSEKNKGGKGCADFNADPNFGSHWCNYPLGTDSSPKDFCCICGGGQGNGGVPPWNNAGCSMDMSAQLNAVNPYPEVGGKNAWHPPSRQGAWHIFDDCLDESGSGAAGLGSLAAYQPSRNYELALGKGDKVVQVDGLDSPLITLQYGTDSSPRTYVFTSKDPAQKIYIKHRKGAGQALQDYSKSSVSGQGTNRLTFKPTTNDYTSKSTGN